MSTDTEVPPTTEVAPPVRPVRQGKIAVELCEGKVPVVTFFGTIVGRDIEVAHRALVRQYMVYRQTLARKEK